jgi:hypothetical protein
MVLAVGCVMVGPRFHRWWSHLSSQSCIS